MEIKYVKDTRDLKKACGNFARDFDLKANNLLFKDKTTGDIVNKINFHKKNGFSFFERTVLVKSVLNKIGFVYEYKQLMEITKYMIDFINEETKTHKKDVCGLSYLYFEILDCTQFFNIEIGYREVDYEIYLVFKVSF